MKHCLCCKKVIPDNQIVCQECLKSFDYEIEEENIIEGGDNECYRIKGTD